MGAEVAEARLLEPGPEFRHVFRLRDGEVLVVPARDARRVLDRRGDGAPVVAVWEVEVRGVVRRLWPEEIAGWDEEDVS